MFAQCRCGRVHLEQMTSENSVDVHSVRLSLRPPNCRCKVFCLVFVGRALYAVDKPASSL